MVELNLPAVGIKTQLLKVCADNKLATTQKVREKGRDKSTSLNHFLSNCEDFKAEKSQMAFVLEDKLHVMLRMTPKCHPEIAGQGIEYAWGYAKLRFRQHFNDRTAANLDNNVRNTLSLNVLTREHIKKFICKVRDYKLTYLFLLESTNAVTGERKNGELSSHSHDKIEFIIKLFKQHRSALDSDYAFIKNA